MHTFGHTQIAAKTAFFGHWLTRIGPINVRLHIFRVRQFKREKSLLYNFNLSNKKEDHLLSMKIDWTVQLVYLCALFKLILIIQTIHSIELLDNINQIKNKV